jgi:uncharacterized protein with PIN domain
MSGPVQRFAVDRMLGRLARWLRILGHDVAYGPHLRGAGLVACARAEGRTILTRDTRLVRMPHLPPHVFIASDHFREQLRQLAGAVPLDGPAFLARCLDCNRVLDEAPRAAVRDRVPPYVLATAARFHVCPRCGRVYWPATHRTHMLRELAAIGLAAGEAS